MHSLRPIFLLLLLSAGTMLLSCSGGTDPEPEAEHLSARIDNRNWSADEFAAERIGEGLKITGTSFDGSFSTELSLLVTGIPTDTAIMLGDRFETGIYVENGITYVTLGHRSGTMTITELTDTEVAGYFGFTARDTLVGGERVSVTNGSFRAPFR